MLGALVQIRDFHSAPINGLIEDRVTLLDGELVHAPGVENRVDDINRVGRETFREVVGVEPATLTLMMCGPAWRAGATIDEDGNYTKAVLPDGFNRRLCELNPHQC
jgi:hypothetical protein